MDYLLQFLVFSGKLLVVFMFIAGIVTLILALVARQKMRPELEVENLNQKLDDLGDIIRTVTLDKKALKTYLKEHKKSDKKIEPTKQMFLLKFEGDLQATNVATLSDEITAILTVAQPDDEVVVVIESPGGTVHGYGLGAAQLLRLKNAGLKVTACVDKVAASGGYMMACIAHQIVAAPFAIVGSIGVLAQVPNVHRLLKRMDVDYEEVTSGEYKRTVSLLGAITDKGRQKFKEQIEDTHDLFKMFVKENRPNIDLLKVATGEYWFGMKAKEMGLVDEIATSDEYVLKNRKDYRLFRVHMHKKKTISEKMKEAFGEGSALAVEKILNRFDTFNMK